jgi:hypothetical protein
MPKSRRDLAQQRPEPDTDYAGFPSATVTTRGVWYRNHTRRDRPDNGAWWFASSPEKEPLTDSGRFDLPAPFGTCYLANTARAAVRELIGPSHTTNGWVDGDLLKRRVVSALGMPHRIKAADVSRDEATDYRVSNELTTTSDYATTQAWARELHGAGFDAIRYALRFSPGSARGVALFGDAGAPGWPGDLAPVPVESIVRAMHIEIVEAPHSSQIAFADPDEAS